MAYRDSTFGSGTSATPSVAVPAGVAIGDIVILVVSADGNNSIVEPGDWPAGFTELAEVVLTNDGQVVAVGWKRLSGVDSGTYDFASIVAGTPDWLCQAFAFSGRHATDPPVISTTASNNDPNTTPVTVTANGVTAVDGDDLLWVSGPDVDTVDAGNLHTPPAGYIEAEDAEHGWVNLSGAYKENVAAGATGTVAGTFALAAGDSGWAAWVVRIPTSGAAPRRWIVGSH